MTELVTLTDVHELADGDLQAFDVKGIRVAVAGVNGTLYAFDNTCTHLHCSLAEGELAGTVVTCPCHGSQFDVTTGAVLRGPAREPVRSYPVERQDDRLQIEM
jgi:3-phenylpropionate/trans-cinnamate dioxygenase ferredoxin component